MISINFGHLKHSLKTFSNLVERVSQNMTNTQMKEP